MQLIRKGQSHKVEIILTILFIVAVYFVLKFIPMTEGDDTYFYEWTHKMGFWEYLKFRYNEWEGRMTTEAMTYISWYFGRGFWEVANACIFALLPIGIFHLIKKMIPKLNHEKHLYLYLATFLAMLFMHVQVIGYSAFWITGSTFYLWSVVAGIWAAMPFAQLVFLPQEKRNFMFLYAIPCGFIAAMGLEQIAAVVITFGILAVIYHFVQTKDIPWLHILEIIIMIISLYFLFISPGTSIRTETEINRWLPQFGTMSVGEHIFITSQWLLSMFANESKMYLIVIWGLAAYHFLNNNNGIKKLFGYLSILFLFVGVMPYFGINFFSEMGIGVTDITQQVTKVATINDLSPQNMIALMWWSSALIFTLVLLGFLFETKRDKLVSQLLLLASIASGAILVFSPTIYASGQRIMFVTEVMLWILCVWIFALVKNDNFAKWGVLIFFLAASLNFFLEISHIFTFFSMS